MSVALSEDAPDDVWEYCRANDTCTIEFDHLANQESDPFLFLGKIVDREHPQWKRYRKVLRSYPDVNSCLVESEREKKEPNLLKLDWEEVGAGLGAEVCVFRIFRSMKSVNRIYAWLNYQGFDVGQLKRTWSDKYVPRFETQPISSMTARWTVEQYREINPSILGKLTSFDLALRYELVLGFSAVNEFVAVQVVIPSK